MKCLYQKKAGGFWFKAETPDDSIIAKDLGLWAKCEKGVKWFTSDPTTVKEVFDTLAVKFNAATGHALTARLKEQEAAIAWSKKVESNLFIPAPDGMEYLPHQRAGIEYILAHKNVLIADPLGVGKTVQAIGAINALGGMENILIICPASIKLQWRGELAKWLTLWYDVHVVQSRSDAKFLKGKGEVWIINYALLPYYADQLKRHVWDVLIVDECHSLSSLTGSRTALLMELDAKRKIYMSATPSEKPIQLRPLIYSFVGDELGNFWDFAYRYCAPYRKNNYGADWTFDGAMNLEELNRRMRSRFFLRRSYESISMFLPDITRTLIPLSTKSQKEKSLLRKERVEFETEIGELDEARITPLMATILRELGEASVPQVASLIEEFQAKGVKKLVVFYWHRDVGKELHNRFKSESVLYSGGLSKKNRVSVKSKFIRDDTCKIFFGQLAATSEGMDGLQLVSSTVLFAEVCWSARKMQQAEGRLRRKGQEKKVNACYAVYDGSLSATVMKRALKKQHIMRELSK